MFSILTYCAVETRYTLRTDEFQAFETFEERVRRTYWYRDACLIDHTAAISATHQVTRRL